MPTSSAKASCANPRAMRRSRIRLPVTVSGGDMADKSRLTGGIYTIFKPRIGYNRARFAGQAPVRERKYGPQHAAVWDASTLGLERGGATCLKHSTHFVDHPIPNGVPLQRTNGIQWQSESHNHRPDAQLSSALQAFWPHAAATSSNQFQPPT